MFNFWKKRSQKPVVAEQEGMPYPFFFCAINAEGNTRLSCSFPNSTDPKLAHAFGKLLFLLNEGSLLESLQQAVVKGGMESNNENFARAVLISLNDSIYTDAQLPDDGDEPIISPTAAFDIGSVPRGKK